MNHFNVTPTMLISEAFALKAEAQGERAPAEQPSLMASILQFFGLIKK